MVTLNKVEIPGFGEAVRKERQIRDRAFLGGNEILCGIIVRPLSLRTALYLEHSENGFFLPFRYDDGVEVVSHALQVLWYSRPGWSLPKIRIPSLARSFVDGYRLRAFEFRMLSQMDGPSIVREVTEWVNEAMIDCPPGNSDGGARPSYASHVAHLVDVFAAANLKFTYDEIMDMSLKRLWQHWRLAANRVYDVKLTNPSDELAVQSIAKGKS